MASFSVEDFIGNGILKGLLPRLLEEGWDDVPTLKMMNAEDMNVIHMTEQQKDALGLRSYLHDRGLMQYAEKMEASRKSLPEILNLSSKDLSTQFDMKRGHIARFVDRTKCDDSFQLPAIPARKRATTLHRDDSITNSHAPYSSSSMKRSYIRSNTRSDKSLEQSMAELEIKDGHIFKGIVASGPAVPRACGCVQAPVVAEQVATYAAIENISVQRLTPEYKIGMEPLVKAKTPPMKASELWRDKPAVILCLRRPGCIMCRAEAHQLFSRKPIFDALGIKLIAVLHEHIESEVKDFWPRYWGGIVLFDRGRDFFKALGGGKQFIERNFGDWAPIAEVIEICKQLQVIVIAFPHSMSFSLVFLDFLLIKFLNQNINKKNKYQITR